LLSAGALAALFAVPASAAEISGQVTNGTTGQPLPGQFINLLALRGQMVPVRETETDSEGRFRFVVAANPNERFLVQVPYRGVMYSQPALFATGDKVTVNLEVFEADARPRDVVTEAHTIFLQPHRGHVRVTEFFLVKNTSSPPRTYAADEGTFRFTVPGVVGDLQVSAGRAGGASLRQQPQPLEKQNSFAISYAFKPGDTELQISYAVPMADTSIELNLPLTYQAPSRHVAIPRQGVTLQGSGLTEIQQAEIPRARVYSASVEAPGILSLRLEADAAALAAAETPSPAAQSAPSGESQVKIVPHPVNRARWYIVALTLIMLSFGLYYLYSIQAAPTGANVASSQTVSQPAPDRRADG
jgi:hypothetical protein